MKKLLTIAIATTLGSSLFAGTYIVKKGDTVGSIALSHGINYTRANFNVPSGDINKIIVGDKITFDLKHITPKEAFKIEQKDVCNVEKLGINKVLMNAKTYNSSAIKEKVEYRRLSVNNSDLIIAVENAIKSGATMVNPKSFKGKKSKTKLETAYAAWRSCTFGLNALQSKYEAKATWKEAVPGDGYKYKERNDI